jgi:hypothetical protein
MQVIMLGYKSVRVQPVMGSKRAGFAMSVKAPAKGDHVKERSRSIVHAFFSGQQPRPSMNPARVRGRSLGSKA